MQIANGEKPIKKNGLIFLNPSPQTGAGARDLKIVSPSQDAIEQARSDLKRGVDDTDIYDSAIYNDVKRRKLSNSLGTKRRRKPNSNKKKNRKPKSKSQKGRKKGSKKQRKQKKKKSSRK